MCALLVMADKIQVYYPSQTPWIHASCPKRHRVDAMGDGFELMPVIEAQHYPYKIRGRSYPSRYTSCAIDNEDN